jgi:mono/diheme cytochrome c family protein
MTWQRASLIVLAALATLWMVRPSPPERPLASDRDVARIAPAEQVARGRYLAVAGNCQPCHTQPGGQPYAGGRALATPFGLVYGSNLTSDRETGIGRWTADDFWQAMHDGRSRDGRPLYPAFPYPNFTLVSREDSDALFAYLGTLPPASRSNTPHELRRPFDQGWMLELWRLFFFRPADFRPDRTASAPWNRGAYLVRGLGHCSACHARRNALGGFDDEASLAGGMLDGLGWYAPSLQDPEEGGVGHWPREDVVRLLRDGIAPGASAGGPMAEVVRHSTQHLTAEDLLAVTTFLQSIDRGAGDTGRRVPTAPLTDADPIMHSGRSLYEKHCSDCHGSAGEGRPPGYPGLAGNRAVVLDEPANVIRMVLDGGFPAATAGNPQPYGMPPFGHTLGDEEVAAVTTYVRAAWGNAARAVSAVQVNHLRGMALH